VTNIFFSLGGTQLQTNKIMLQNYKPVKELWLCYWIFRCQVHKPDWGSLCCCLI